MDKCKDAGMPAKGEMTGVKKVADINVNTGSTGGSDYNSETASGSVNKGKAGGSDYYSDRR